MVVEAFLPVYQQVKLKRNGLEKFFSVNLTKFKIANKLFFIQRNHNLFIQLYSQFNLFFCEYVSLNFPLNLRHSQNFNRIKYCRPFIKVILTKKRVIRSVFQSNFSLNLRINQFYLWKICFVVCLQNDQVGFFQIQRTNFFNNPQWTKRTVSQRYSKRSSEILQQDSEMLVFFISSLWKGDNLFQNIETIIRICFSQNSFSETF